MAFKPKEWKDEEGPDGLVDAAALIDLEERVTSEAALPTSVVTDSSGGTLTAPLVIEDPDKGHVGLKIQQAKEPTAYGLEVLSSTEAQSENLAILSLSGTTTAGPFFHWNKNGFGIVGDATNAPPYFAIESGKSPYDSVFKIRMDSKASGGGVLVQLASQTGADEPELSIYSQKFITLKPGTKEDGTQTAGSGAVFVQAAEGFVVQSWSGATFLKANPGAKTLELRYGSSESEARLVSTGTTTNLVGDGTNTPPTLQISSNSGTAHSQLTVEMLNAAKGRNLNIKALSPDASVTPALNIYTGGNITFLAGRNNAGEALESGAVFVQAAEGFVVQDASGATKFAINPKTGKVGFFGHSTVQRELTAAEPTTKEIKELLQAYGLCK